MSNYRSLATTRPSLRLALPLIFFVCWGFVVFNCLLGLTFATAPNSVHYLLSTDLWAAIFFGLGLIGALTLVANWWEGTRLTLVLGCLIKFIWLYFLVLQVPRGGIGVVVLWGFLAYVQALIVIYFPQNASRERR